EPEIKEDVSMELTITKVINGKKVWSHTVEGENEVEAINEIPERYLEGVYQEVDRLIEGFEDAEFPLEGEEAVRYDEAVNSVLEDAFWNYCDMNNIAIKWDVTTPAHQIPEGTLIFDNGGGLTIQLPDYAHWY